MEKHLKFKMGYFNCNSQKVLYLLKCRMCGEALMLVRQKQNLEQDYLILNKVHLGPIEKYHSNVFMNIIGNTAIMGLMISSSH